MLWQWIGEEKWYNGLPAQSFFFPVMMRINLAAAAAPLNELENAMNFFLLLVIFVIHLEAGLPLMSTHALHKYQSAQ